MGDGNDLHDLLGIPFSAEQLAAITAPMEPGVIVAGAGSGKTTVMAARVVWLVGTGQVLASQVLGLTFTTKAAAELGTAVRTRLQALASFRSAESDVSATTRGRNRTPASLSTGRVTRSPAASATGPDRRGPRGHALAPGDV